MIAPSPTPAVHAASDMSQPSDSAPSLPPTEAPAVAEKPTVRDKVAENLLTTILGSVVVALLGFTLVSSNVRITRLEDKVDARFLAQDDKIERKFSELDAKIERKFSELDAKIDGLEERMDAKIDGLEERIDAKIDGLEERIDARFAVQDEKFAVLDEKIDEIGLKLTALIAGLGMTGAVEAAVDRPVVAPSTG